ncbi:Ferric-pseudobactin receptor precursor [compost metagenome]
MKLESKGSGIPRLNAPLALRAPAVSAVVLGLALAISNVVQAAPVQVDIPAQALSNALTELGRQTGLQILFEPGLVSGKKSTAVSGSLEPDAALKALLGNAGLTYRIQDNTVILSPESGASTALELSATTIQGQGMGEATENSGSYTTGLVSAGSKTPTSLKNTPQSVSVVTQQMVEDLRMVDLSDALKRTPGITVKNSNYRLPQFLSRGFPIDNIQIDGASPMDIGSGIGTFYANKTYDMAEFDHIEVLRGSSGLFGGTGDPGGIINAVRKRPLDYNQVKINASAGSWDNYRTEIDVTGPLAFDGRLRGRLVTAYTDRQYFYDNRSTDKPFLYGVLEGDITDTARVTLGGRYERIHENGTGDGLPRFSTGKDLKLSRSTWYTPTWAYSDNSSQEWFAKYDQDLTEDWKLNVSYTNTYDKTTAKSAFLWGAPDPETMEGATWGGSFIKSWSEQSLFDANVSGKFSAFGREHELLVGADAQKVTSRWRATWGMPDIIPIDVYDPDSTPLSPDSISDDLTRDYSPNTRKQYGLYSTLRLQLSDPLQLIVGARAQRYKFEQTYKTLNATTGNWDPQSVIDHREPTKVVPFGGLVYALDDQWSTYLSYSEIFKPQAQRLQGPSTSNKTVEPMVGKTYETGIKGELFGGSLNVSAALFYTKREHEAIRDPAYTSQSVLYGGSCCYLAQGEVVSKGVDLEASGEVLPGLMVMGGYTYTNTRNRETSKAFSSVTPKHLAKLWAVYTMPDEWADWKVGGGVTAQSANYVSGTSYRLDAGGNVYDEVPFDFSQGGYAVWDAMVEYRVDEHWTVALNGNNLFDRKYYETVNTAEYGNYYGAPRNYMLTLRGQF